MRIKGFNANLRCRDMQYEIGKEYKTDAKNITKSDLCSSRVFHYCDTIKNVDRFYACSSEYTNRYCEIEALGEEVTDGIKYGTNHIKIIREIVGDELNKLKGLTQGNTGCFNKGGFNTGEYNIGCYNTGNQNNGKYNTGDFNEGDINCGDENTGYYNAGSFNFGSHNTGTYNIGDSNTGKLNIGDNNSGENNFGDKNSGIGNLGNSNIGDFSVGDYNYGVFCIEEKKQTIPFFNEESDMTLEEWHEHPAFDLLEMFRAMRFKTIDQMTDEEKVKYHPKSDTKGYVVSYKYKEAWSIFWNRLTSKQKEVIKTIPNFDPQIFEQITGIKIE